MKKLVQIHGWVVDGCVNVYSRILGYEKVINSFYKPGQPVNATRKLNK